MIAFAWAKVKPINILRRKVLIGLLSAHGNNAKGNILEKYKNEETRNL